MLVPYLLYLNADGLPHVGVSATTRKTASAVLITFVAAFAVLGTKDFLTRHRVGWDALAELQQTAGVSAHDIDGGFEYNGWFFDGPLGRETANELFLNENAKYPIESKEKAGFKGIKKYEYFNWMPPKYRTLLLLKRD
jgi:hypothetical protein